MLSHRKSGVILPNAPIGGKMKELYKTLLEKNPNYISTSELSHEKWLEKRMSSVGGSDAGAIMGLNEWASPLTVYLSKKGLNTFEGNIATARGNFLEAPIRNRCREELECEIEEVPFMFYSDNNPFMSANIDSLIYIQEKKTIAGIELSGFGGHEIKTSERGNGFDEDDVPASYYAQVQHYMSVLNLDWFVLSAYLINKNELRHYTILRDDEFIKQMIEAESDFWFNFVEKDVMPAPSGVDAESDLISDMFEGATGSLILDDEAKSLCAEYSLINKELKDKEQRKREISNTLKLKIIEKQDGSDDTKAKAVAGDYKLSFTKSIRKSVNSDALKKDGLYEKYTKESEVATLRITAPKEAK